MGFEIKGLKELQAKVGKLAALDGKKIPLGELLTPAFVASASRFGSVQELFDASGFQVNKQEDLATIPADKWDQFISANTTYQSWSEMMSAAFAQWTARQ
jgi:hypothetical protein